MKPTPIAKVLANRIERFKGFARPNTTPCPDELFDRFMYELTYAELKVLLYIIRRTYGFKKANDTISLKQISEGIVKKDGVRLDRGADIDRRTAMRAIKRLETKGLILIHRTKLGNGNHAINTYSLRFQG